MRKLFVRGFVCAALIALGGFAGACSCGDDGGDGDGDGDGDADAAVDAPEVTATRAGAIALTQIAVLDITLDGLNIDLNGGAFTVAYDDLTTFGGTVTYTDGDVGCTVTEFDASGGVGTDNEATEVDEGPVVLTNFAGLGNINCAFLSADLGYRCAPAADATATVLTGSTMGAPDPTTGVALFVSGDDTVDFEATNGAAQGARGMTITFPPGTWPTNGTNDGTFPIVQVINPTTVAIVNPGAVAETLVTDTMDYSLGIGNGPIPGAFDIFAGGNMNAQFTIAGGQEEGVGAIDMFTDMITPSSLTMGTEGDGITLNVHRINGGADDGLFDLEDFPTLAVTIGCDVEDETNNCANGGPISALIVSGRTTDGALEVTGNPVIDETSMPDPVGTYTTFTCVFLGQKQGAISQGAIDAIRANTSTRIETRVIFASGRPDAEEDGDTVNRLAGYAVIGWDDTP